MNRSIASFEGLIDRYADYLNGRGIRFDPQGFPILEPQVYLDEWPTLMVPYRDRKARFVRNPSRTVLCLFTGDARIYPRLENALDDIPEYRRYLGTVGSDLTVTSDMDPEWQRAVMLINQLYTAVLAVNGVKVVQNLRCGSPETSAAWTAFRRERCAPQAHWDARAPSPNWTCPLPKNCLPSGRASCCSTANMTPSWNIRRIWPECLTRPTPMRTRFTREGTGNPAARFLGAPENSR